MNQKRYSFMAIGLVAVAIFIIAFFQWGPSHLTTSAEMLSEQDAKKLVEERYKGMVTRLQLENGQYSIVMRRNEQVYEIKLDATSGNIDSFEKTSKETAAIEKKPETVEKDREKEINTKTPEVKEPPTENAAQKPNVLTEEKLKQSLLQQVPGELQLFKKINENGKGIYKAIVVQGNEKTIVKMDAVSGEIIFRKTEKSKEPVIAITEGEAQQIALQQVNGRVDDIDLKTKNGLSYYIVEIETNDDREADVQVHAITGEILSVSWDD